MVVLVESYNSAMDEFEQALTELACDKLHLCGAELVEAIQEITSAARADVRQLTDEVARKTAAFAQSRQKSLNRDDDSSV